MRVCLHPIWKMCESLFLSDMTICVRVCVQYEGLQIIKYKLMILCIYSISFITYIIPYAITLWCNKCCECSIRFVSVQYEGLHKDWLIWYQYTNPDNITCIYTCLYSWKIAQNYVKETVMIWKCLYHFLGSRTILYHKIVIELPDVQFHENTFPTIFQNWQIRWVFLDEFLAQIICSFYWM